MTDLADLVLLLDEAKRDLSRAQARIDQTLRALADLPIPADPSRKCPTCGITTRGPLSLAEHIHTSHGGPLPDHWARAERLAGLEEPAA